MQLESILTCPKCGYRKQERMPENACIVSYDCRQCGQPSDDLRAPPNNRLMKYKGGYKIRVNDQYRITFKFDKGNATDVCVADTH